jgi:hypothetical protein
LVPIKPPFFAAGRAVPLSDFPDGRISATGAAKLEKKEK